VTPETVALAPELLAWLRSDDQVVDGWAPDAPIDELRCHPDLVERLTQIARPQRGAARVWVTGCPVVHHRDGPPIACATGTSRLVVRSAQPAGALASHWQTPGLDAAWVDLDPWAADVTFARTLDMLRAHVARAYELAGERAWH
jgi:hypothetical protein